MNSPRSVEGLLYASLTGPLVGLYYPMPKGLSENQCRIALSTSKLKNLWCSIYTSDEVDESIKRFGGEKLGDGFAKKLDYDSHAVKVSA